MRPETLQKISRFIDSRWGIVIGVTIGLLFYSVGTAFGQQCQTEEVPGTGDSFPWRVYVEGVERSKHSRNQTASRAADDFLRASPDVTVEVRYVGWIRWRSASCGAPEAPQWPPVGECPSCPPAETTFVTDTLPDPETEAALAQCQLELGICSVDLATALAEIDRLLALPPDTAFLPEPPVEFEADSVGYFPREIRLIALGENHTRWADSVVAGKVWRNGTWPDTLYVFQREDGTWPGYRISEAVWRGGKLWWAAKLGAEPFAWDAIEMAADTSVVTYRASGTYLVEVQPFQFGTTVCRVPNGEIVEALWTDVFVHGPDEPLSARLDRRLLANPAVLPLCEVAP
jgi:hypothetical protein